MSVSHDESFTDVFINVVIQPQWSFQHVLNSDLSFSAAPGAWKMTLAMVGKFCIALSFTVMYIVTVENFPTSLR